MGGGSKSLFLPPSGAACSAPQPARSQSCGEGSGSQGGRRGVAQASLGLPVRPGHPPYPHPGNLSPSGLQYHHQEETLPLCSLPGKLRPHKARGLETGDHPWPGQAPSGQVSPEKGQRASGPRTNSREQRAQKGPEEQREQQMARLPAAARSLGSKEATAGQPAPASPDWGLDPQVPWSGVDREGAKREGGARGSQGCSTPRPRPPGQRPGTWSPGRA